MKLLKPIWVCLVATNFCFPATAEPIEVVPQIALDRATVFVADETAKEPNPKFTYGDTAYNSYGSIEWRTKQGKILKIVPLGTLNTQGYATVIPSPDGTLIAVQSAPNETVSLRNAWTGEVIRELTHQSAIFRFSPNGKLFASTEAGSITVREVQSNHEVAVIKPSVLPESNLQIQFSPDNTQLLVYSLGKRLEVFEIASGRRLLDFVPSGYLYHVRYLPTGIFVASHIVGQHWNDVFELRRFDFQGHELQKQNVMAPNTNALQFRFVGDTVLVEAGYEKRSDQPLYFAFEDGKSLMRIDATRWDVLTPKAAPRSALGKAIPLRFVRAVAGKTLVSDGQTFWNGVTGQVELSLSPIVTSPTAFDVSRDAKSLAVAGFSNRGVLSGIWTRANQKLSSQRVRTTSNKIEASDFGQAGDVWVSDAQFSPDGQLLATASGLVSQAPPLILQNASTGKILWTWQWEPKFNGFGSIAAPRLDFAPNGKALVFLDNYTPYDSQTETFSGQYGRLKRADSQSGEVLAEVQTLPSLALDYAPDGSTLAVSTQRGQLKNESTSAVFVPDAFTLELRDPGSLELRKSIPAPLALQQISWSRDGRKIAGIGSDTTIYLLDVATEKWTKLIGHAQVPRDVCWLSTHKLASCADDGRVIFWNSESGKSVATTHFFQSSETPIIRNTRRGKAKSIASSVQSITTTRSGFFSASPHTMSLVRLRQGTKLLSGRKTVEALNNPAEVRAAVSASF